MNQNLVFDDQRQLDHRSETVKLTLHTTPFHVKNELNNTIDADLLWQNQEMNKDKPYLIQNNDKANRIVLNDVFLKNVKLKVDSDEPVKTGKFESQWLWTATNSI